MRDVNELSKKAYDSKAEQYEKTFDGRFTNSFKETLISKVIVKEGDKILDVACGTGELLKGINQKCPIYGTGIDISEGMIKTAKKRNPSMKFEVMDCTSMDFNNEKFNAITVSAAFHHFPKPSEFAGEAYRVLVSRGRIYIAEVYLPVIIRQVTNAVIFPLSPSGDVRCYTPRELINIFRAAGFRDVNVERKGIIQYMVGTK